MKKKEKYKKNATPNQNQKRLNKANPHQRQTVEKKKKKLNIQTQLTPAYKPQWANTTWPDYHIFFTF